MSVKEKLSYGYILFITLYTIISVIDYLMNRHIKIKNADKLMGILTGTFLLQFYLIPEIGVMIKSDLWLYIFYFNGNYVSSITSVLSHQSTAHFLSNIYALALFRVLYNPPNIKFREYVTVFLFAGVLSTMIQYYSVLAFSPLNPFIVGASGGILALFGLHYAKYSKRIIFNFTDDFVSISININDLLQHLLWMFSLFIVSVEIHAQFTVGFLSGIGHMSHITGFMIGVMSYYVLDYIGLTNDEDLEKRL